MRLVITDTGFIWNKDNPFLKKYKDIILVVCLGGNEITDQYECFVSPYEATEPENDSYGLDDNRFKALVSVANRLNQELLYHDRIVFLTDTEPSTLYPYYVLKNLNEYNSFHLVSMAPMAFETNSKIKCHEEMLSDLRCLSSFLYYDTNVKLKSFDKNNNMDDLRRSLRNDLGEIMPCFLDGIYRMKECPCYFDFASMSYVLLEGGYEKINLRNKLKSYLHTPFPVKRRHCTLGLIVPPKYSENDDYVKHEIERPVARMDGKRVCNILKEQRVKLARANGIPFKSVVCPSIGPCAGTCNRCDEEAKYLSSAMMKIPEEKRIYPHFNPAREVAL